MKRLFLACALIIGSASVSAGANAAANPATNPTTNPTIQAVQAKLDKPHVLCGRFDQSKQLAGFKKPLTSHGRFCVVVGKGVVWRTLKPFANTLRLTRDEIVQMQGDKVGVRLDANKEPTVRIINGVMFSLLAGDFAQLDSLFEVRGGLNPKGDSWRVELTARQALLAKTIGKISLTGDAYVKSLNMVDGNGDHTDIVFSDIKTGETAITPDDAAAF